MKRISFKDSNGLNLTQMVLSGKKTMTRRNTRMYKVGDVVAIQQPYKDIAISDGTHGYYKIGEHHYPQYELSGAGWYNKMFVRADLMPHHILITDVRQERLQDISDEDCMKEGVLSSCKHAMPFGIPDKCGGFFYYSNPHEAFSEIIDKVSGSGTWKSNPMVWVYEFELVD